MRGDKQLLKNQLIAQLEVNVENEFDIIRQKLTSNQDLSWNESVASQCMPLGPFGFILRLVSPTTSGTKEKSCQPLFELLSPLWQKRPVQWLQLK